MKHILRILLFSSVSLFGLVPLHAQWERIGWEGGKVTIAAQLGNTLYGRAKYSLYKSTDWGKTWNLFHDGLPNDTLYLPRLHPFKDYLIADPYFDNSINNFKDPTPFGFYYCKEGDRKWTFKFLSQLPCNSPLQIFYFSGDSVLAYGGCENDDIGYYFSNDGGFSWERRMQNLVIPMNQHAYTPFSIKTNFFFQLFTRLYRTTDFGLTWDSVMFPGSTEIITNGNFDIGPPYIVNDSILLQYYALSSNKVLGVFRSTDKGTTWNKADFGNDIPQPYYFNEIKAIGEKTFLTYYRGGGAIHKEYVSDDLGLHWRGISALDSVLAWEIFGKDNHYILSTSKGNPQAFEYLTTDSTFATLTPLTSSEQGVFADSRTLVGVIDRNLFALPDARNHEFYDSIIVSTNNGLSWEMKQFLSDCKLDYHRWAIDGKNIYASGLDHFYSPCLFRSTDEGMTWTIPMSFTSKDRIKQLFIQNDTMVVARSTDILLSIDKGRSWIVVSAQISDSISMSCRNGILALFNTYADYLSLSSDLGQSWMKERPFKYNGNYGSYVFGDRIFSYYTAPYQTFSLYYRTVSNGLWRGCSGLPIYTGMATFPNCDDGSILYATCPSLGNSNIGTSYTALYYSEDSGSYWKQLGDFVTNSQEVFIGSDYLFLSGPTELWRGPKPAISSRVDQKKSVSSISINKCYPNPAASEMRISYSIPKRSNVTLSVFDMTGKEIITVASEVRDAGSYEAQWDSRAFANGSYILKLTASGESVTKVVEVIK